MYMLWEAIHAAQVCHLDAYGDTSSHPIPSCILMLCITSLNCDTCLHYHWSICCYCFLYCSLFSLLWKLIWNVSYEDRQTFRSAKEKWKLLGQTCIVPEHEKHRSVCINQECTDTQTISKGMEREACLGRRLCCDDGRIRYIAACHTVGSTCTQCIMGKANWVFFSA